MNKQERYFQSNLIKEIKARFPGCMVLKNDASYVQGIPDLLILFGRHWAGLEVKRDQFAPKRPNQERYVAVMNNMSYCNFIYPENKEDVLDELALLFTP